MITQTPRVGFSFSLLCRHSLALLSLVLCPGLIHGQPLADPVPVPNAWRLDGNGMPGGSYLHYVTNLTAEQQFAATNSGWRYTVECRMIDDFDSDGTVSMIYGDGTRRYALIWDFDDYGAELTATWWNGPFHYLSRFGVRADLYHTHELTYDPETAEVVYRFEGYEMGSWAGNNSTSQTGQARWGTFISSRRGRVNFHRVQFEIVGLGVVASYDAGTEGNPAEAPDPVTQGWTASAATGGSPVSPDMGAIRPGVLTRAASEVAATTVSLRGLVSPRGSETAGWFEWGVDTNYGQATAVQDLGTNPSWAKPAARLENLELSREYHYRVVASNSFGINYGLDRAFTTTPFTDIDAGLTGVYNGSVAWGDYDNDSDLDLVLVGGLPGNSVPHGRIYRNEGNDNFVATAIAIPEVYWGQARWGDCDQDGDLDLFITGCTSPTTQISTVYRNQGEDLFVPCSILPATCQSAAAWGDADNDGDLDLLLVGLSVSDVFFNEGETFTPANAGLPSPSLGSVDWGDYDNDGDLDILLAGRGIGVSRIYRNDGPTGFVDIQASLDGIESGTAAWGDYDSDGDLDILLAGSSLCRIYRNDDGRDFIDIGAAVSGLSYGGVAWGDYDNDGDLDLVQTGGLDFGAFGRFSRICRNDGGGQFVDINAGLPALMQSAVAWGDYDNDGDLDLVLTGMLFPGEMVSRIYRNDGVPPNAVPTMPEGLTARAHSDGVTFEWQPARDSETPASSLSYNLLVGASPEAVDLASPMSDVATGCRLLSQLGGINLNTSWTLHDLPPRPTYWSVQAVDSGFRGGLFAPRQAFLPLHLHAAQSQARIDLLVEGMANLDFHLQSSDDLTNWANIASLVTDTNGRAAFRDPVNEGKPVRFYRLTHP